MKKIFLKKILIVSFCIILAACAVKHVKHEIDHLPDPVEIKDVKVALVLGGGGSRGVAHLGVISALEDYGIPIDLIVGTSAGAIVGSLYADYADSEKVKEILEKHSIDDYMSFSYVQAFYGFFDIAGSYTGEKLEKLIAKNLIHDDFSKLKIPLVVTAADLMSKKSVAISGGKISPAVRASSMAPPFFPPTNIYGRLLVDGGVVEPVPVVTAMRYKPDIVIAVDISIPGDTFELNNMVDVTLKSLYISYYVTSRMQSSLADITIHPKLEDKGMFESGFDVDMYNAGREEAINQLPHILELLQSKGILIKPRINYFKL